MVASSPAAASRDPSGDTSRVQIVLAAPLRTPASERLATFQTRTLPSYPALYRVAPSGLNATAVAPPGWFRRPIVRQSPVSCKVIRPEASLAASKRPSRLKAGWRGGALVGHCATSEAAIRGPCRTGVGSGEPQLAS